MKTLDPDSEVGMDLQVPKMARINLGLTPDQFKLYLKKGLPVKHVNGLRGVLIPIKQAQAWIATHGHGSKPIAPSTPVDIDIKHEETKPDEYQPDSVYERTVLIEKRAFDAYQQAVKMKENIHTQRVLMKLHIEAGHNVKLVKATEVEFKKWTAHLIEELAARLVTWIEPGKSALEAMPRAMANRVNAQDPGLAERQLRQWVQEIMMPLLNVPKL